jgi:hypothetical protein
MRLVMSLGSPYNALCVAVLGLVLHILVHQLLAVRLTLGLVHLLWDLVVLYLIVMLLYYLLGLGEVLLGHRLALIMDLLLLLDDLSLGLAFGWEGLILHILVVDALAYTTITLGLHGLILVGGVSGCWLHVTLRRVGYLRVIYGLLLHHQKLGVFS